MRGHPLDHVAERHHVAAVVVQVAGQQPVWRALGVGFAEEQHIVARDFLVQRAAEFFPVGDEFGHGLGVHHRARQNVCAGL